MDASAGGAGAGAGADGCCCFIMIHTSQEKKNSMMMGGGGACSGSSAPHQIELFFMKLDKVTEDFSASNIFCVSLLLQNLPTLATHTLTPRRPGKMLHFRQRTIRQTLPRGAVAFGGAYTLPSQCVHPHLARA